MGYSQLTNNVIKFQVNSEETQPYIFMYPFSPKPPTHPVQFSSVQSLSRVCNTPGLPVCHQLPESTQTISVQLVMPSNHLILCHPFLLLPPISPSIRVFSNESALRMRWPEYWSFSFSISPSNAHPGLISFRMDWISLQSKGLSRVFSSTTVQKHQFFGAQLSF